MEDKIARLLRDKILNFRPNHRVAKINNFITIIKKMHYRDKVPYEEMFKLIDWYPMGQKYIPEIYSPGALREKYEKLYNAWERNNKNWKGKLYDECEQKPYCPE